MSLNSSVCTRRDTATMSTRPTPRSGRQAHQTTVISIRRCWSRWVGAREPLDVEQVGVGDVVGGGGAAEGPTAQVSDATRPLPMPRQPWVAGC
jgi:hypothetical protein